MAGLNPQSQLLTIAGPAGPLELVIDTPPDVAPRGVVVVCHPHPLHGGTMDNKVVQTLARAFLQLGYRVARFNFRGVGASAGQNDEGRGEVDDALAVIAASEPPASMMSASPRRIVLKDSPMPCAPEAQALTMQKFGPRAPNSIATMPLAMFEIMDGIMKGETLRGPFSIRIRVCVS